MYYVGDTVRMPVPDAEDCWECYNGNVLHDGYCPGVKIDGVKRYALPPKVYPPWGPRISTLPGGSRWPLNR